MLVVGCRMLSPSAALAIEDDASAAGRTEQPLAVPRVAEPERSAADIAHGQDGPVTRTEGTVAGSKALANRALLGGIVRGLVASTGRIRGLHGSINGDDDFAKLVSRREARVGITPPIQGPYAIYRRQQVVGA